MSSRESKPEPKPYSRRETLFWLIPILVASGVSLTIWFNPAALQDQLFLPVLITFGLIAPIGPVASRIMEAGFTIGRDGKSSAVYVKTKESGDGEMRFVADRDTLAVFHTHSDPWIRRPPTGGEAPARDNHMQIHTATKKTRSRLAHWQAVKQ